MVKAIGISRPLKLEWLNKTVELLIEGKSDSEIIKELNEYLSFEISSPTNLRKTRESLINTWVRTSDQYQKIKDIALDIYPREDANKLVIHWCMLLLAFPVFLETCSLIGKITDIQGGFTTSWIRQKLFDQWGERTTLYHSARKILQSLRSFGVIENIKDGEHRIKTFNIQDKRLKNLLVLTTLSMNQKAYYEVSELTQIPQMFPFEYSVSHEMLHSSDLFVLTNFGGKVVVMTDVKR